MHDLLLNLLFNAADALPSGGTIRVETRRNGETVILSISDDGVGMDEGTLSRIFEPFFTTKMEVGTGLGLSTAYGSIQRWGGDIDVESGPGKGTRFKIRLPEWKEVVIQERPA